MAFLKKEVLEDQAMRYGIDISDLSWPEKNRLVREALEADGKSVGPDGQVVEPGDREPGAEEQTPEMQEAIRALAAKAKLEAEIEVLERKRDALAASLGTEGDPAEPEEQRIPFVNVIAAPEIRATGVQLLKYDEVLGDDVSVEEVSFKDAMVKGAHVERDMNLGTYRIKGRTGRKVVAQSTVPKENAGVTYNPATDLVPVVSYAGRRGYVFTHQHYPNVKELLKESGAYHKYRHLFSADEHPENIWYSAGKILTCDIDTVHAVFREIEEDHRAGRL